MPRFLLTLEYDGAPFAGWQRQDNGPSVQVALEDAVKAFAGRSAMQKHRAASGSAPGQLAHRLANRETELILSNHEVL